MSSFTYWKHLSSLFSVLPHTRISPPFPLRHIDDHDPDDTGSGTEEEDRSDDEGALALSAASVVPRVRSRQGGSRVSSPLIMTRKLTNQNAHMNIVPEHDDQRDRERDRESGGDRERERDMRERGVGADTGRGSASTSTQSASLSAFSGVRGNTNAADSDTEKEAERDREAELAVRLPGIQERLKDPENVRKCLYRLSLLRYVDRLETCLALCDGNYDPDLYASLRDSDLVELGECMLSSFVFLFFGYLMRVGNHDSGLSVVTLGGGVQHSFAVCVFAM